MDFGYCPAGNFFHSFPEEKDEIYKAFSPFSIEAAQGEVWDKEVKRMVTLQEKEYNKDNDQVANQEWLLDDEAPAPKHRP